jgi:hypothetical protein
MAAIEISVQVLDHVVNLSVETIGPAAREDVYGPQFRFDV